MLQLRSGRIIDACVQLIRDNYIIVTLPQHNYGLAYAPTKLVRILMCCKACTKNVLLKMKFRFISQSMQSCQAHDNSVYSRAGGTIQAVVPSGAWVTRLDSKEVIQPSLNFCYATSSNRGLKI